MADDAREDTTADVTEPKMTTTTTVATIRSTFRLYGFYSKETCGYCKMGSASSYGATCPPGYCVLSKDYEAMMLVGWRRCGSFFYKPNLPVTCCPQYTIRLAVNDFRASRSQRVVLSRVTRYCEQNGFVLTVSTLQAVYSEEIFMLYKKYQIAVHGDPEEKLSPREFTDFLVSSPLHDERGSTPATSLQRGTFHQHYRLDGKLIAVGVIDISESGISSVYCFYDPELSHLSLGKYAALREIEFVRAQQLQYYYLGFYIPSCPKMNYKGDYKPSELLCPVSLKWYPLEQHCLPLLKEFKFTPFDPDLIPRRRELELLIVKQNSNLAQQIPSSSGRNESCISSATDVKDIDTSAKAMVCDEEVKEEHSFDDESGDTLQNNSGALLEFQPQFHASSDIRSILLRIRSGVIRAELLTESSLRQVSPILVEWLSVCPPDVVSDIELLFS